MDTISVVRLFCDGTTSMQDVKALVLSMGHSEQDFVDAFNVLSQEPGSDIRFQRPRKDELRQEFFLTTT